MACSPVDLTLFPQAETGFLWCGWTTQYSEELPNNLTLFGALENSILPYAMVGLKSMQPEYALQNGLECNFTDEPTFTLRNACGDLVTLTTEKYCVFRGAPAESCVGLEAPIQIGPMTRGSSEEDIFSSTQNDSWGSLLLPFLALGLAVVFVKL